MLQNFFKIHHRKCVCVIRGIMNMRTSLLIPGIFYNNNLALFCLAVERTGYIYKE